MDTKNNKEFIELSQNWSQVVILGKYLNRIKVGKDGCREECTMCFQAANYYHLLGCPMEFSPCKVCQAPFLIDCQCEYHEEEDE